MRARPGSVLAVLGAFVAAAAVFVAVPSCGPSFQAVYEGDARFEHCYALDDHAEAPLREKAECWRDWTKRYTFGQTRDRVDYAKARYDALTRVRAAPTDEAMMQAAPGEGAENRSVATPSPTSAFAPPPKLLAASDGGGPPMTSPASVGEAPPATSGAPPLPPPPHAACTDACSNDRDPCVRACGKKCAACDDAYNKCMKRCFR